MAWRVFWWAEAAFNYFENRKSVWVLLVQQQQPGCCITCCWCWPSSFLKCRSNWLCFSPVFLYAQTVTRADAAPQSSSEFRSSWSAAICWWRAALHDSSWRRATERCRQPIRRRQRRAYWVVVVANNQFGWVNRHRLVIQSRGVKHFRIYRQRQQQPLLWPWNVDCPVRQRLLVVMEELVVIRTTSWRAFGGDDDGKNNKSYDRWSQSPVTSPTLSAFSSRTGQGSRWYRRFIPRPSDLDDERPVHFHPYFTSSTTTVRTIPIPIWILIQLARNCRLRSSVDRP